MAKFFSVTALRSWYLRYAFSRKGLKSTTVHLHDGATAVHLWVPKIHRPNNPNLLLIHGFGVNATWQYNDLISPLGSKFNLYVPDLLFFGDSHTTRSERTEQFQADCLMKAMDVVSSGVDRKMQVMGLSYGGFVGYSMAARFPEKVEKAVICCSGVCMEENDMKTGVISWKSSEEIANIVLAQTPEKMRELMRISFYKPPQDVPSYFLSDLIDVMISKNIQEKKELLEALHKDRKLSNIPKITQPTLIIWGEHDQTFPPELGHRLKRHIGENAELVIVKDAGHAITQEKPKELSEYMTSFLSPERKPQS